MAQPTVSLIFDIETRLDTDLAGRCGYTPKDGAFPPLPFHLPVAIAIGCVDGHGVLTAVESLGTPGLLADDPCDLTTAFWQRITQAGVLIGFNSRGFDMPVMELCALRYGCAAPRHWGEAQGTRYRDSKQHLDLLDVLSNYAGASRGYSLNALVQLLGYAGKDGMDGSAVQSLWDAGELETIMQYNRLDIVRTYALWLA